MRKKISVIGEGVQIAQGLSRAADVADDVRGADVVVLAGDGDLAEIARSAPAATIVVTGEGLEARCKTAYEHLLFPRSRIVGVADPGGVSTLPGSSGLWSRPGATVRRRLPRGWCRHCPL